MPILGLPSDSEIDSPLNAVLCWSPAKAATAYHLQISAIPSFTSFILIESSITLTLKTISLRQDYPNPFNPSTTIEFELPKSSFVLLKVLDVMEKEITTLIAQEIGPGSFTATWRADMPSGIYS